MMLPTRRMAEVAEIIEENKQYIAHGEPLNYANVEKYLVAFTSKRMLGTMLLFSETGVILDPDKDYNGEYYGDCNGLPNRYYPVYFVDEDGEMEEVELSSGAQLFFKD